jgi:predicted glycosyltransferase
MKKPVMGTDSVTLRVLVDIGHPAHVHMLKNIIWRIEKFGGKVCITTRLKDVATDLLEAYGIEYHIIGHYTNLFDKAISMVKTTSKLLKIAKEFNPHVFLSCGSVHGALAARILNRICITLIDTEGSIVQGFVTGTFSSRLYSPEVFVRSYGEKHIRYNGYHEMAYLLPKYFKPDVNVLSKYGLTEDDIFFVVRVVSWNATHDWGQRGIGDLPGLVQYLQKHGKVVLSMESGVSSDLEDYTLRIAPEDLHSMLACARAYVGEGATMASESASLGTPSIYLNTQVLGYINEEMEAGLVSHIIPSEDMDKTIYKTIDEIMTIPISEFKERGKRYVSKKIDVIEFISDELLALAKRKYS